MTSQKEPYKNLKLSSIIENVLKSKGWDTAIKEHRVFSIWEEAVGTLIFGNARPKDITRGILFVTVRNSVWSQELSLRKTEIINRLNDKLGKEYIKDIKFIQGKIEQGEEKEKHEKTIIPDDRVFDSMGGLLKEIPDEELKAIVRGILKKALAHEG